MTESGADEFLDRSWSVPADQPETGPESEVARSLSGENSVVYGGGGALAGAVARAFGREGARVFLVGRTRAKVERVAAGGSVDVVFNGVEVDNGEQGRPLVEMSADEYVAPIETYLRTQFLTAMVAARRMRDQGAGVVLTLSNPMGGRPTGLAGSFGQGCAAVENMTSQLAQELGGAGIRVVCLRPTGMPDSVAAGSHVGDVWRRAAERLDVPFDQMLEMVGSGSPLGRAMTVEDVAEVAAFVASGRAAALTATVVNVSGGAVLD